VVAAFGIPALIFICIKSGYFLLGFTVALAGLGGAELAMMFRARGYRVNFVFSVLMPILIVVFTYYKIPVIHLMTLAIFIQTGLMIIYYSHAGNLDLPLFVGELLGRLLPVIYVGLLLSYVILIGASSEIGGRIIVLIFMIVWATDTFAYAGGRILGKHKLSPFLSPNKTWEGFYAGFIGALIAGALAKLIFLDLAWPKMIVISLLACLLGQSGDLFESALKRHCRIKDSSSILPGHGGILDRFDSFLFAIPIVYLILIIWR